MLPDSSPAAIPIRPGHPALILASSSRYRRELLERLRIPFSTAVPAIDETPHAGETPEATALRLAEEKARAVAATLPAGSGRTLVIGSDQVATFDGRQIGKPGTHERALEQLQSMRGREVLFHSALSLLDTATGQTDTVDIVTKVRFRDLPDAALDAYLRAEEPYDCAGSAKSEGLGIALLEAIESDDPTALIGLPLIALTRMLLAAGYPLLEAQS
ncbi:Maf-like protein [Paraburkholderia bannensis]|uniref:Maf-like protein n=1 Tax=Paraburkholderia bannensis TaxID=765414 RepID=UPI002AAF7CAF|nr:Maf-like protein [Paraburkholderia bannensis]